MKKQKTMYRDKKQTRFRIRTDYEQADVDEHYGEYSISFLKNVMLFVPELVRSYFHFFFKISEMCPDLFSIKLHHGGNFTKFPHLEYVEGMTNYIDLIDPDFFSVHELDCMLQKLGYGMDFIRYYHYKVPNEGLDFGLRALGSDLDVIAFCKHTSDHKIMNVYTEFDVTNLFTYICSHTKARVVEVSGDVSGVVVTNKKRINKRKNTH